MAATADPPPSSRKSTAEADCRPGLHNDPFGRFERHPGSFKPPAESCVKVT